jgi:hypothetical protein
LQVSGLGAALWTSLMAVTTLMFFHGLKRALEGRIMSTRSPTCAGCFHFELTLDVDDRKSPAVTILRQRGVEMARLAYDGFHDRLIEELATTAGIGRGVSAHLATQLAMKLASAKVEWEV